MSDITNETINPKDPKNKHLFYLYPYIVYCRNFGPNSPATQVWDKSLTETFDFEKDFVLYINTNIKEIVAELNARWIAAVCDVYVDCSNKAEERLAALLMSTFIRQTQVATTHLYWRGGIHPEYKLTEDLHKQANLKNKYNNRTVLWSGMHGVIGDDIYRNLFYRTNSCLKDLPVFLKFFRKVVKCLVKENTTVAPEGAQEGLTPNTRRYVNVLNQNIE